MQIYHCWFSSPADCNVLWNMSITQITQFKRIEFLHGILQDHLSRNFADYQLIYVSGLQDYAWPKDFYSTLLKQIIFIGNLSDDSIRSLVREQTLQDMEFIMCTFTEETPRACSTLKVSLHSEHESKTKLK